MIRHTHFSISGNTIECIVYLECLKKVGNNVFDINNDFRIQNIIAKFYLSISQWGQVNKVGRKEVELYI